MLKRLKQIWPFRRKPTEVSPQADTSVHQNTGAQPKRKSVILCGPDYGDEATAMIGSWLGEIQVPPSTQRFCATGNDVTRETIAEFFTNTEGTQGIKIFAGHGTPQALLGPAYVGCEPRTVEGVDFAVLYDSSSFDSDGLKTLFAFCCKSARELGMEFAQRDGRTFLGYIENIGYDLTNVECRNLWKNIIQLISNDIIQDGSITSDHETSLISLYEDAIDYFMNGAGRNNDRNIETLIVLTKHKKFLRRFGGSPHVSNYQVVP